MDIKLLKGIKSPADVKKLSETDISVLCDEIREVIVDTVSKNGGHLASNLGAVELTVALHRVFSSPNDAIIFDVGHQSYTHKLLTGRYEQFATLRKKGGLSGFMRPDECEHDPFVTGHSSNSISAAYGIFKAKKLNKEDGAAVVVIGDGAMTGGMVYEALNNAALTKGNFIVVLNDNKMSISKNVGAMSRCFTRLRTRPKYHKFKFALNKFLLKIPVIGEPIFNRLFRIKEYFKKIVYRNNIFVNLGYNYLGPVDGHDVANLESIFNIAKSYNRPTIIHVVTTKGKGYFYAEDKPKNYHGVSPFDIDKGADMGEKCDFSSVAGKTLEELAEKNDKICAITAAMTEGTGLYGFSKKFKERFFDVGIAEQHAVTFSAGLASKGVLPFFCVYSSFLQRGYDQIIHDAAIADLPLKLLVDRAGFVGEDGESHQGLFDVAYLSSIPNMNIYSPSNNRELIKRINETAENTELCAIRYPRGCEDKAISNLDFEDDYTLFGDKCDNLIITYGREFGEAYKAYSKMKNTALLKLNKIYPINGKLIDLISKYKKVHFFEEGINSGGIGEHIAALLLEAGYKGDYHITAVKGVFAGSATINESICDYSLDSNSIKNAFK